MKRRLACLAALALLAGIPIATAVATSGERPTAKADGLVFTREDGTTFSFAKARVSCGKSRNGGKRKAIFVDSIPNPFSGKKTDASYFTLEGVLRDIAPKGKVRFPHTAVFGHPSGAGMFVFDRDEPQALDGNELSTAQEEARGKIVFRKASCRPRPRVAFTIDARLGSEIFGLPNLKVEGSLHGVGAP
jgi:hypothetical protein